MTQASKGFNGLQVRTRQTHDTKPLPTAFKKIAVCCWSVGRCISVKLGTTILTHTARENQCHIPVCLKYRLLKVQLYCNPLF